MRVGAPRAWLPALALGFSAGAFAQVSEDPLAWLQRAAAASRTANYSGTYVHTSGERTQTLRITHVMTNGDEHEKIETLDGPRQEIVRRNDEMYCYLPDAKTIRLDRRVTARFFPSIFRGPAEALAQNYTLKLGKVERVVGHDCQWIRLDPKDGLRFAQRLCAETGSGLLIRALTLNDRGRVIEQFTFTDLKLGPQVARGDVKSAFQARLHDWKTDPQPRDETRGAVTGWEIINPPAGFRQISEMRRTLPGRTLPVSQIVLTDGLASMSVFVEASGLAPRSEGASEDGNTSFYVKPAGDHVVTVLGEVPVAAAQQAARAVSRRP